MRQLSKTYISCIAFATAMMSRPADALVYIPEDAEYDVNITDDGIELELVEPPEVGTAIVNHDPVAEASVGLPQLDPTSYPSQIFWLGVSFIILYVLMSRLALPRVGEILDIRSSELNGNLSQAEKLQEEVDEVRLSYEDALDASRQKSDEIIKSIEAKTAQKIAEKTSVFADKARQRLEKAEAEISAAKTDALSSLEDIAADITKEAVKKIADISVDKKAALSVVKSEMKEAA